MRSWLVYEYGEPVDVLKLEEIPKPLNKPNEVLIKVKAVSLNFFDILLCQGKYQKKPPFPFTVGAEISGEVVAVHKDSKYQIGQRVIAKTGPPAGGLAEYVSVNGKDIFPMPASMSWAEAAAMFVTYHTSYYALHNRANIQQDEVLLVHAGAGGVGSAAIQLGKEAGAYVIATAGGKEKTEICRKLGADIVVDYLTEDFVEIVKNETNNGGADIIFDPVGSEVFNRSRKCIAFDGRLLVIGFAGGRIPTIEANHILLKNYSVVGVHWGAYYIREKEKEVKLNHEALIGLYEKGTYKPLIFKEFDFMSVPVALKLLSERKTWGKLVVRV